MSRVARMARIAVAGCLLPVVLSACAAAWSAPAVAPILSTAAPPVTLSVHVVSYGWHTGIVLRAADVSARAWPARADFPDAQYLEVGWGDRDYYQASAPGLWLALKAVFWPTPGVLRVVAFDGAVERYFGAAEVIEIGVSEPGLRRMLDYVRNSHELDAAGRPMALGPDLYGHSRFYASRERFHLFKTCNVWVATVLREAGLPVTPALTITAGRLMAQLRPLGRVPENRRSAAARPRAFVDNPEPHERSVRRGWNAPHHPRPRALGCGGDGLACPMDVIEDVIVAVNAMSAAPPAPFSRATLSAGLPAAGRGRPRQSPPWPALAPGAWRGRPRTGRQPASSAGRWRRRQRQSPELA